MLKKLETELKIRGFSKNTIKSYIYNNQKFLEFSGKPFDQISTEDIKSYLAFLISDKGLRPSSVSLALSAIRFYFEEVEKKKLFDDIRPPKSEKKIPTVLSKQEIRKMFDSIDNPKHKLLVKCMYGSGLRVSECVSLKVDDIDYNEKIGKVRAGKGKKDRYIIMPATHIDQIKQYAEERDDKSEYLFPSNDTHITARQAQKVVKSAALKAGIKKRVFCHALRSSFATHLLESGTDIRVIQELLGHSNLATTERYTKVSAEQIKKVKSPLEGVL